MTQAELVDKIAAAKERIDAVRQEVGRVYIGPGHTVGHMLVALLAGALSAAANSSCCLPSDVPIVTQ